MANLSNINNVLRTGSTGIGINCDPEFTLDVERSSASAVLSLNSVGGSGAEYLIFSGTDGSLTFNKRYVGDRLYIASGGNVGIGTSSPDHKLRVNGDARLGNLHIKTSDFGTAGTGKTIYADGAGTGVLGFISTTAFDFSNGSTSRVRIDSSGRVGIKTTSPTADLSVGSTSTSSGDVHLRTTKTTFSMTPSNTDAGGILLDVGWVSGGQGPLKFGIGGSEKMRIDSSGNVGIGTSTIRQRLHQHVSDSGANYHAFTNSTTGTGAADGLVIGISADEDALIWNHENENILFGTNNTERMRIDSSGLTRFTVDSGTASAIDIGYVSSARTIRAVETGGGNARPLTLLAQNFTFKDDSATRMVIDSAGNIGIGTSSPSQKLYVVGNIYSVNSGTDGGQIRLANSGGGSNWYWAARTTGLNLGELGAADGRIFIANGGSVGIGTTSPSYKLQVNGNAYINTTLYVNGATTVDDNFYVTNGNVGIGTTSPDYELDVAGEIGLDSYLRHNGDSDTFFGFSGNDEIKFRTAGSDRILIDSSGTTTMIKTSAGSSTTPLVVRNSGSTNVGTESKIFLSTVANDDRGAYISSIITDASNGNALILATNTAGSSPTERMRIDSSGRVGIGTTPDTDADALHLDSSGTNSLKIEGAGSYNLYSYHDSGGVGWATGADTSFTNLLYFDSTNNGIRFYTNSGERMRITSAGAIGIGQTSIPTNTRLNITGTNNYTLSSSSGMGGIKISGTTTGQGNYTSGIGFAFGSGTAGISGVQGTSDADRMGLAFFTHPSGTGSAAAEEKMRIDYLGNVGIGTTSPGDALEIYGATKGIIINNTAETDAGIMFRDSADAGQQASIKYGSGDNGLKFYNSTTERMRITSGGNVGIGLTNPDAKLEVTGGGSAYTFRSVYSGTNGSYAAGAFQLTGGSTGPSLIDFIYSTTFVGQIVTTGTAVLYQSNSDYRLKENVVEMTGALDRVSQLKPNRFNFIADANTTVDGFLAHELQQVVPQAVSGEKDETREDGTPKYQGVDHSQIVPLLVGAIQELKQEIETLKTQINN